MLLPSEFHKTLYEKIKIGDLVKIKGNKQEIGLVLGKQQYDKEYYYLLIFKNNKKQWIFLKEDY